MRELTGGSGVERAVDCSGNAEARATAIRATRKWGKMVMVGEGGAVTFNPSPDIIHEQKTIYGSWVTSTWLMEELVERLVRWNLHPEDIVTHRFSLDEADKAYRSDGVGALRKGGGMSDWRVMCKHLRSPLGWPSYLPVPSYGYAPDDLCSALTIVAGSKLRATRRLTNQRG